MKSAPPLYLEACIQERSCFLTWMGKSCGGTVLPGVPEESENRGLGLYEKVSILSLNIHRVPCQKTKQDCFISHPKVREESHPLLHASFQSDLSDPDRFMEFIRNNSKDAVGWAILSLDNVSELP